MSDDSVNRIRETAEHKVISQMLARAFEDNPSILVIIRLRDGIFLEANEKFMENFGYNREEVIGHSDFELGIWNNLVLRMDLIDVYHMGAEKIPFQKIKFRAKDRSVLVCSGVLVLCNIEGEDHCLAMFENITTPFQI